MILAKISLAPLCCLIHSNQAIFLRLTGGMMKNRFVRTLISLLCFCFTAVPLPAQSSGPKNPDSAADKKCMADCNTPGTKEYKTRSYLRNSCEDVCYYADDELATIYAQAVNQATGEKIN